MKSEQEIEDLFMVGKYMEVQNLFPYHHKDGILGVYIAEDEGGYIDYVDVGINFYEPDLDWNTLMKVCKKIIESYFDKREDIFAGLCECDIDKTYKACVEFIKFWNDDTQPKHTWNK